MKRGSPRFGPSHISRSASQEISVKRRAAPWPFTPPGGKILHQCLALSLRYKNGERAVVENAGVTGETRVFSTHQMLRQKAEPLSAFVVKSPLPGDK